MVISKPGGLIIILVIIAAAGVGGWYFWSRAAEKTPRVHTIKVAKGDLIQAVTATGDLQPVLT